MVPVAVARGTTSPRRLRTSVVVAGSVGEVVGVIWAMATLPAGATRGGLTAFTPGVWPTAATRRFRSACTAGSDLGRGAG